VTSKDYQQKKKVTSKLFFGNHFARKAKKPVEEAGGDLKIIGINRF
jgi:hypothetical protein